MNSGRFQKGGQVANLLHKNITVIVHVLHNELLTPQTNAALTKTEL